MTYEEMEKAMEFIVRQEARSSAKIGALTDVQMRAEERWTRTEEGIRALLAIAEVHERDVQANTQQILKLSETTRATEERLNALLDVLERQTNEDRNGKP